MVSILARAILASRWLLAVFLFGLIAGLVLFALRYLHKVWTMAAGILETDETALLIDVLHLVDYVLVASLVVMVALASYDSLVDRLQGKADEQEMRWVSRTDHANLKIKVATAVVAISSIDLLQVFLRIEDHTDRQVTWRLTIHAVFLVGAVLLGVLDRIERHGGSAERNESV
ncbi:MAG: TIGR00645 family protein [Acetobacteraceae bacterium]|nr:TIGR00645 family protein [Acetobacteraceae bacterium]